MPTALRDDLITWTGMVQDTSFSPEIYSADGITFEDRTVIYAVAPPGVYSAHSDARIPVGISQKLPFNCSSSQGIFLRFSDSITKALDLKPTEVHTFVGELEEMPFPHSDEDTLYPSLLVSAILPFNSEMCSCDAANALSYLTRILQGDATAAKFLLAHLVSPSPSVLCISQLPVNIKLSLKGLLLELPLTLERLNSSPVNPFVSNMGLHSSPLQLPKNTNLWLNESALSTGTLNSQGTKNISCLRDVIQSQRVGYAFEFSTFYFDVTFNVLSTTESRKSILEILEDKVLPFHKNNSLEESLGEMTLQTVDEDQAEIENLFSLIQQVRSLASSFVIPDELAKTIESNFVLSRQTEPDWTADRLARTINLGKILTLIAGNHELSVAQWVEANELEETRLFRLKQ